MTRRLSKKWFYRTLTNGEKVLCTWMAYSSSKKSLVCFCCRLFDNVNTPYGSKFCSSDGFNTWWKLNPMVSSHESSNTTTHSDTTKIIANGRICRANFKKTDY